MGKSDFQLPERNKKVLAVIGRGKDNPTTVAEVERVTGFSKTAVREIVSKSVVKFFYNKCSFRTQF